MKLCGQYNSLFLFVFLLWFFSIFLKDGRGDQGIQGEIGPAGQAPIFRGALAGGNAGQSIRPLSDTVLTWQTESYDTGGFHAPDSDSFVIPKGVSKVRLSGAVVWSVNPTGSRYLYTYTNGGGYTKTKRQFKIIRTSPFRCASRHTIMDQNVHSAVMAVSEEEYDPIACVSRLWINANN